MRLHRLEVTAFGPFCTTQAVDFDSLSDAGLFLLCGPTGAGKTSILDAVCFALYGEVPGDRNSAKRLRSDHAALDAIPVVVLDVSIAARRFRVRRSPAWQRPKRRGAGTTLQNASVVLEERRDGAWMHLTSRLDEAGQLLTELLGMNAIQFCQVAMLPQGRFQSFLRARSDERHRVLQRLFRTIRFEDIERWLVNRRQALKAANREHHEAVASVVSRLSEAGAVGLPESCDLHDLTISAERGELEAWAFELVTRAQGARREAANGLARANRQVESAREALDRCRSLLTLREKHRQAAAVIGRLADQEDEAVLIAERLAASRRAAVVHPLVRVAQAASLEADRARQALGGALGEAVRFLGSRPAEVGSGDLATAEREAHQAVAVATSLLPREAELTAARGTVLATRAALDAARARIADLDARCRALPEEIAALRSEMDATVARAAGLASMEERSGVLTVQLESARKAEKLRRDLQEARGRLQVSVDEAQRLREQLHDIREARITGMAAELAQALAGGEACPVCGSAHHPMPARPVDGAPTQADEAAARAAYEDADFVRQAHAEALTTLERNCALAEQASAGRSVSELSTEIRRSQEETELCRQASRQAAEIRERVHRVERRLDENRQRAKDAQAELATLSTRHEHASALVDRIEEELSTFLADKHLVGGLAQLIDTQSAAAASLARAQEAMAAHEAATVRAATARREATECAGEHGFTSAEDAEAATLEPSEQAALEEALRTRDSLRREAEAVLVDQDVQAALREAPPDAGAAQATLADLEEEQASAGARVRLVVARSERLEQLSAELTGELSAWGPMRAAYATALALSTFAEGKGGDNPLQMRLSAYVLAARLTQVVAAANERLGRMSDERYTLEHSAVRGAGELRGGLSLMVRDQWTGTARDPATLSGGETFVVSLALALGLADVVTNEAGGTRIDTLFIDEGFGSLDQETLDDVMNTLDSLRDGGRVVGVVSHVPEMRTRISAQLQVHKDRNGSRVVAARELT